MGWQDTKLLLPVDGADEATSTVDRSNGNHTVNFVGTAQLDTDQKVFGASSLLLDGNSDGLYMDDHADWNFGTGNFTIDFRLRLSAFKEEYTHIEHFEDSDNFWRLYWDDTSERFLFLSKFGGVIKASYWFPWTSSLNTWVHFALVRNGTDLSVYINGTALSRTISTAISTNDLGDVAGTLKVGYGLDYLPGWLDEIRITKIAEWTGNFTPPSEAYPYFTTIIQDRGIPEGVYAGLGPDQGIPLSGASLYSPVTADSSLPLDSFVSLAEDRETPIDSGGMIRVDRTIPLWSGIDFYSYSIGVDAFGGLEVDNEIPVNANLDIRPDKSIPVDAFGPTIADRIVTIGILEYIDNDFTLPVDLILGLRMDETLPFWAYHDPAENRVLGISASGAVRKEIEIPADALLRVSKPVTIPIAVMSSLYQDIDVLANILLGIRADRNMYADAGGSVAVDNRIMPIDFLEGIRRNAEISAATRGWAAASFSIPLGVAQLMQRNLTIIGEANLGVGPDIILPVNASGQTSNDIEMLVESLVGNVTERELRVESSGVVSADRALITEWLEGVALNTTFRVNPLGVISSDVEISLSILQGQAESAVAADRALSISILQELKEDVVLPDQALQRLEADVSLILEAMETLVADRSIPVDAKYGGIVILSRKIRSLLISEGIITTLWKRGD